MQAYLIRRGKKVKQDDDIRCTVNIYSAEDTERLTQIKMGK